MGFDTIEIDQVFLTYSGKNLISGSFFFQVFHLHQFTDNQVPKAQ